MACWRLTADPTGEFSKHDIAFLQGAANILGMAIERQRYELQLKAALDRQQILLKETSHRVKNSLQIVSAMLRLQANTVGDDDLRAHLTEASSRVSAIGRAYERLSYDPDVENINVGPYLKEVCTDAISGSSICKLDFDPSKTFSSMRIGRFRWLCWSMSSLLMRSNMDWRVAPMGIFGCVWPEMTRIPRSYLCVTTASGCRPTSISARAADWVCGSLPDFQNNCRR
jgi:Histidine kinase